MPQKYITLTQMIYGTIKLVFYLSIIMSTMITFYYVDLYNKLSKQLTSIETRVKKLQTTSNK